MSVTGIVSILCRFCQKYTEYVSIACPSNWDRLYTGDFIGQQERLFLLRFERDRLASFIIYNKFKIFFLTN